MSYDPKSILRLIRNVKRGLKVRTEILMLLKLGEMDIRTIALTLKSSTNAIRLQLVNMLREGIVERTGRRPYRWKLTGRGQAGINEYV